MLQKEEIAGKDKIIVENILVEKFLEFLKDPLIVQMMNNIISRFIFTVLETRGNSLKHSEITSTRSWFQQCQSVIDSATLGNENVIEQNSCPSSLSGGIAEPIKV